MSVYKRQQNWLVVLFCILFLAVGCTGLFDERRYETIAVPEDKVYKIEPLVLQSMSKGLSDANEVASLKEPLPELSLKIDECRALALENNLDLKSQLFNPIIAEENISEAEAYFEPLFFSNFSFAKTDTPTSLTLDASQSEYFYNNPGLRIPLRTGGEITLSTPFSRVETDNEFSTLNPSYESDLSLSINQPLLRGGGVRRNTHAIRVARYGSWIARARTKLEVIRVLAAVDRVYWRLFAARQELRVRKQEYDLATAQLASAQRMVRAGQAAEIEILRAEDAAAQRFEAIILAENAARDRERDMKRILNKKGLGMETATIIISATEPNPVHYQLDTKRLMEYALQNRMELLELELQIASNESLIDYEYNGTLPLLSVNYTYNINGLGPEADDAYDLMLRNRFADQRVGLVLQIPIGNESAKSRWRRALWQRRQRLASKRQREALIKQEVLNTADQMEANWQRVVASRKSTFLAERTMKAEQRQFELGLQISTEVLDAQARFANAQSAEIRALTEYQIAQVDLAYATGSLLGAAQIYWETNPEKLSRDEGDGK